VLAYGLLPIAGDYRVWQVIAAEFIQLTFCFLILFSISIVIRFFRSTYSYFSDNRRVRPSTRQRTNDEFFVSKLLSNNSYRRIFITVWVTVSYVLITCAFA
jgi:hypothetical protein